MDICKNCYSFIQRGVLPYDSLACVDPGLPIHASLPELRTIEELVVAPVRVVHQVIIKLKVACGLVRSYAQSGHVVAFPQGWLPSALPNPTSSTPQPLTSLPEFIQVVLIGAVRDKEHAQQVASSATPLNVRGQVVLQWCMHLANQHPNNIQINQEALADIVRLNDQVPQPLLDSIHSETDPEAAAAIVDQENASHAGYAPNRYDTPPDIAINLSSDNTTILEAEDEVEEIPPSMDYFIDGAASFNEHSNDLPPNENQARVARFLLTTGSTIANDYNSSWFCLAFVSLFPFGVHGLAPPGMSVNHWGNLLLQRFPRQFAQHNLFLYSLFDIQNRHAVNSNTTLRLKSLTHQEQQALEGATNRDLQVVISAVQTKPSVRATQLDELTPTQQVILRNVSTVNGRIPGTSSELGRIRSRVNSAWVVFGAFTFALNINPSEISSPIVFSLAGNPVASPKDPLDASNYPDYATRIRIIAKNPIACAQFYEIMIRAFGHAFLGFPEGSQTQIAGAGCFGPVSFWFIKRETGDMRGGLHGHGQIASASVNQQTIIKMLGSVEFRKQVLDFLGSISCSVLPTIPTLPITTLLDANDSLSEPSDLLQPQPQPQSPTPAPARVLAVFEQYPHSISDVNDFRRCCSEIASKTQIHHHTATCGKNQHMGDDSDCRLGYPRLRLLQPLLSWDPAGFFLPRSHNFIVAYNPAVAVSMRCNQAVYAIGEASSIRLLHNILLKNSISVQASLEQGKYKTAVITHIYFLF